MKRARDPNVDDEWSNIGSKRIRDNKDDAGGNQATAMLDAVKNGDIVLVRTLLEQESGSLCVNAKDKYERRTPLIVACLHGHLEIVKMLLEHAVPTCKLRRTTGEAINLSPTTELRLGAGEDIR